MRRIVVLSLALALWYGAIVFLVDRLAPTLDQALVVMGQVNRILGIAAVVLVLLVIVWVKRRRRARE